LGGKERAELTLSVATTRQGDARFDASVLARAAAIPEGASGELELP
jgi:hypothetical protein